MDDVTYERLVDAKVWRRLQTDSRYRNAENAEEQAEAEAAIVREVEVEIQHVPERRAG